jgi:hypothetical protein
MNSNLGRQFPVYSGPGLADNHGPNSWRNYALSESPRDPNEPAVKAGHNHYTAMVPTQSLLKYREYDRTGIHGDTDSEARIQKITEELKNGGTIREPLHLAYDHDTNWGYLGEGHHRLEAALRAGVTHVPLTISGRGPSKLDRIKMSLRDGNKSPMPGASLHLDNRLVEARGGYYPSALHPGNFQEFEGSR